MHKPPKLDPNVNYVVVFWTGDARECTTDGLRLFHVLNVEFVIEPGDGRVRDIRPVPTTTRH